MIPKLSTATFSNIDFLVDYFLANEACILDESFTADWPAIHHWKTENGRPNLDHLVEQYGDANVPVLLGDEYITMEFSDFVERYIRPVQRQTTMGYLKDWHFQNAFANSRVYQPPAVLASDWINNETWTADSNNVFGGDYRFVYFGAAGSWTPFHCDVMCSYSWSANICGRKLWYLLRPGAERHFAKAGGGNFIADLRELRDRWPAAGVMKFEQKAGEIIFVPSAWYHQVHNLEDTISINHNVINAFNVPYLLQLIKSRREDVECEIDDVRSSMSVAEFDVVCEVNIERLKTLIKAS